jgi:L-lactate utilization protein LutB
MNQYKKWQCEKTAGEMVKVLNEKGYDAHYVDNLQDAKKKVLEMIPKGSSIALGGSVTLTDMDLLEIFRTKDYKLFDRYQNLPFPEIVEIMRQSLLADFLVTGSNAVTRAGELVNMDSSGNRVSGIVFGPKRVIVVVGTNKVVDDLDEAFKRMYRIAPMNALRNGHKTPCVESGKCEDCQIQQRLCNSISIVNNGRKFAGRISVIMVAEETGF